MNRKIARALVRKVGNDEGLLSAVVGSTASVDRYGEIIDQKSWDLKNYKKNPVILWAHNMSLGEDRPAIGRAVNVGIKAGKLVFDIQFDMADPFAADIFRKYKEKFLSAFSVGFIPHTIKRYDEEGQPLENIVLMDNELLELSAVPVPANPEALNQLRRLSFKTRTWEKLVKEVKDEEEEETLPKPPVDPPADTTTDPPADPPTPKITDVEIPPAKDEEENKGGPDSGPKNPPLGAGYQKLARVMREATKMLQGALAEYNQSLRK
jgi:uncharacterized protein